MYELLKERFESKFQVVPFSGCWLWDGTMFSSGYGALKIQGVMLSAHRLSWTLYRGTIPDNLWVLHKCDVRCCVNPEHLYLGTPSDNVQDMLDRKGTSHYFNAKATHCIRGHPLSGENLYLQRVVGGVMRVCRICKAARKIEWRARRRAGGLRVT